MSLQRNNLLTNHSSSFSSRSCTVEWAVMLPSPRRTKAPGGSPCVSHTAQWGQCRASTYVDEQMNRRAGVKSTVAPGCLAGGPHRPSPVELPEPWGWRMGRKAEGPSSDPGSPACLQSSGAHPLQASCLWPGQAPVGPGSRWALA